VTKEMKPIWVRFELAVSNLSDSVEALRDVAKSIARKEGDDPWTIEAVDALMNGMRHEMDVIASRIDKACDDAMCARVAIAKHRIEVGIIGQNQQEAQ